MTIDQATFFKKLRADTLRMFGFDDKDTLSPAQSMSIDLAVVLRSEIDAIQGAQIAGRSIDVGRLSDAIKLLRQLLPQDQSIGPEPDFAGARERLAAMLTQQHDAQETGLARWPDKARADLEERIKLAIAAHPDIVPTVFPGGAAIDEPLIHPALRSPLPPPIVAEQSSPIAAEQSPPSPPEQTTTSPQPPLPPPTAGVPRQYLRDDGVIQIGRGYDRWSNRG